MKSLISDTFRSLEPTGCKLIKLLEQKRNAAKAPLLHSCIIIIYLSLPV